MNKNEKRKNNKKFIYVTPLIITCIKMLFFIPASYYLTTADGGLEHSYETFLPFLVGNKYFEYCVGCIVPQIDVTKYILEGIVVFIITFIVCLLISKISKNKEM